VGLYNRRRLGNSCDEIHYELQSVGSITKLLHQCHLRTSPLLFWDDTPWMSILISFPMHPIGAPSGFGYLGHLVFKLKQISQDTVVIGSHFK
jgi:hypothetical protein